MVMTGNEVAPRLFCDICDMFDQHDTDDCPKQSDCYNEDDGLPPSRHHGDPSMERPYCDICEGISFTWFKMSDIVYILEN